jgi:hypothetical protein
MPQNLGEWFATVLVVVILVYLFTVAASDENLIEHFAELWRVYVR